MSLIHSICVPVTVPLTAYFCLQSSCIVFFTDFDSTQKFLLQKCQQHAPYRGGFSKVPNSPPDILHSFYSLCWLSLLTSETKKLGIDKDKEVEKEEDQSGIINQKIDVEERFSHGFEEKNESAVDRFMHNTVLPIKDFPLDVIAAPIYTAISDINCLNPIDPRFTLCTSKCSYVPN